MWFLYAYKLFYVLALRLTLGTWATAAAIAGRDYHPKAGGRRRRRVTAGLVARFNL